MLTTIKESHPIARKEHICELCGCKSCHWYQHLSNPESKSYIGGSCFIGVSIEKRYKNRKICTKKSKQVPEPHKKSLWRKLLKLLGIDK